MIMVNLLIIIYWSAAPADDKQSRRKFDLHNVHQAESASTLPSVSLYEPFIIINTQSSHNLW